MLNVTALVVVRGARSHDGKVLLLFAAALAAVGAWLALVDRLEPRLAAALSRRLAPADPAGRG